MRRIAAFLATLALPLSAADSFDSTVAPFLARHCTMCHNAKAKMANLDLDRLRNPQTALSERDVWETVVQRVRSGQMPPKGAPKPAPDAAAAVIDWAEKHIAALDAKRPVNPGRVTARRLNRAEYNNTIRDLLGIQFRPADDFPLDDSGHGFDNIADVLTVSPSLLEKYLEAAEQIVRVALRTSNPPKPIVESYNLDKFGESKTVPADPEGERLVRRGSLIVRHRFPYEAEYEIRIAVRGPGNEDDTHSKVAILVGGRQAQVVDVITGPDQKRNFDLRLKVPAGESEVGAAFVFPGPGKPKEQKGRPINIPIPGFYIDTIDIHGPFVAAEELPDSHKRVFTCAEETADCARRIVAHFAARAWRRPVTDAETAKLLRFVDMARQEGDSFRQGIALAVKAALVSPNFLFRIEPEGARELNDFELASRLSYFLWSSMPDDRLFDLARQGTLRKPEVLTAEVKRMLADPKSAALADNFAGQWLELRNLAQVNPDPKRFPTWDADLREAMKKETLLFFEAMIREDRNILDFIDGNFTFLNDRLAQHYGIEGVEGRQFRRVELNTPQRGGLLAHASVLTVSSYPTRTSPVMRGLWVLENFLATRPPAPPANVPTLKEEEIGKTVSLRQQLERHRADPACAVCHDKMDALGFGLENYNAIGAWRTEDGSFPIDAAGTLPGNRSFTTPAEMKAILRADADAFTRCLTEKLMTFALGRGIESSDKPVLRAISKDAASQGYRFSSIILGIVNSPPFRMRSGEGAKSL
ncbi:MAG: DUF1592 domain-containing protein [Bryobacterales bacterium]|nr:DUF1592 domain-containing protein [Bryobacterales bacterium]